MSKPEWEVRALVSRAEDVSHVSSLAPDRARLKLYAHSSRRLRLLRTVPAIDVFSDDPVSNMISPPYEGQYLFFIPSSLAVQDNLFDLMGSAFKVESADLVRSNILCETNGKTFHPKKLILGCFAVRVSRMGRPKNVVDLPRPVVRFPMPLDAKELHVAELKPKGISITAKTNVQSLPGSFEEDAVVKKVEASHGPVRKMNQVVQVVDSAPMLDLAYFGDMEHASDWNFVESRPLPETQEAFEREAREIRSNWIAIRWDAGRWSWRTVTRTAFCHMDKDVLAFPGLTLVHPGRFRLFEPLVPDVRAWTASVKEYAHVASFDVDGNPIEVRNKPEEPVRSGKKLKVAVLSMCGVTTFEDRYGLGGEHQVVHWLREAFLKHPDVEICDIYDTANVTLAPQGFYDLVLSNSCWTKPPKKADGGLTIFWHFNTNAYQGNEFTIQAMGYDVVWTNSPISFMEFERMGLRTKMKHLNASSEHHHLYPWESKLFVHDACYIGGYQVEYKGKSLIDRYTKPLMKGDLDFVIYGNRKWRADVQREALKHDRYFREEHLDESFEPFYRGVLHPDDFRILAKNCKVCVNFNSEDQRPLGMVNDRPIWLMGCGGFVVTDESREQRALYGNTCDYSGGDKDLHQRVTRWIEDEDERKKRAEAAYKNIVSKGLFTKDTAALAVEEYVRWKG